MSVRAWQNFRLVRGLAVEVTPPRMFPGPPQILVDKRNQRLRIGNRTRRSSFRTKNPPKQENKSLDLVRPNLELFTL